MESIEQKIIEEGLDYKEFAIKHPNIAAQSQIEIMADPEGILANSNESPFGASGFIWGFCLGWVGMLIVYLTMDEGSERKKEVKTALIGCVVANAIFLGLYLAFATTSTIGYCCCWIY